MSEYQVYTRPEDAKGQWRVHVAAVGFGELNRLLEPLKILPVDAFYLLQYPQNDRSAKWYREREVDVLDEVRKLGVRQVGVWPVNVWSAAAVGNFIGRQMTEEGFSELDVNVSCGPKTVGIGATLASLFWPVRLYYADVDYDVDEKPGKDDPHGYPFRGIQRIPTFHTEPPRTEMLETLALLVERREAIPAVDLKQELRSGDPPIIRPSKGDPHADMSAQAVHSQFQNLVRPMLEQHLIEERVEYGKRAFRATPQGVATLRLLRRATR